MARKPKEAEAPSPVAGSVAPPISVGFSPDGKPLTIADVERMLGGALKEVKRVDAPLFYAATVTMMASGNDFTLVFSRPHPVENADGTMNMGAMVGDTVAIISITPQTAKDLLILLQNNLPQWEALFGVIKTPFTIQLENAQQKTA